MAIYVTCYGDHNEPEVVEDMVAVLNHNGISVRLLQDARCCGMPKLELGDLKAVEKLKDANLPMFLDAIDDGYDLMSPIPSCVLMYKQEVPLMFPNDADVARVKAAFFDPFEYLMLRHKAGLVKTDFRPDARQRRLSRRMPPARAEHRHEDARLHAADPGDHRHRDRTLLRPRRHVCAEERDVREGDEDRAAGRYARRAGRRRTTTARIVRWPVA